MHPTTHSDPAKHHRCAHHFLPERSEVYLLLAGEHEAGDLHPCGVLQPESSCSWHCGEEPWDKPDPGRAEETWDKQALLFVAVGSGPQQGEISRNPQGTPCSHLPRAVPAEGRGHLPSPPIAPAMLKCKGDCGHLSPLEPQAGGGRRGDGVSGSVRQRGDDPRVRSHPEGQSKHHLLPAHCRRARGSTVRPGG